MVKIQEAEKKQDKALFGLPQDVRFCKRCVISNQRPSSTVEFSNTEKTKKSTIFLDEEGVCSACRYAEMKNTQINWEEREKQLWKVCDRYRSRDGSYDCLVPGSGGKDSAFTSHILKEKYGMHPLTVTWAPHRYTEIGWKNFQNWIDSGIDNILFTPNGRVHRLLTRLAFENLCHPFQPFIIGQKLIAPRFASLYKIPLIFYGENQAEYGNRIEENFKATMSMDFYSKGSSLDSLYLGGVSAKQLIEEYGLSRHDLSPYFPMDTQVLDAIGCEVHYLGYYLYWDPQECYYYASQHTGFEANSQRTEGSYSKYSSIDDKMDPLHFYTTYIKFGLGRASYDAAQEIRTGKITRQEGMALVKRFDCEFPDKHFSEMLDYMWISSDKFFKVIDRFRSPHLWEKIDDAWILKHAVYQ